MTIAQYRGSGSSRCQGVLELLLSYLSGLLTLEFGCPGCQEQRRDVQSWKKAADSLSLSYKPTTFSTVVCHFLVLTLIPTTRTKEKCSSLGRNTVAWHSTMCLTKERRHGVWISMPGHQESMKLGNVCIAHHPSYPTISYMG